MTNNHPSTELLSDEALERIEKRLELRSDHTIPRSQLPVTPEEEVAALCQTVRALRAENRRIYTPSIVEALRLLDDAGFGKEVPNSLSDMIAKALTELQRYRQGAGDA